MYYINASSSISFQNSFQNEEWINNLTPINENSALITPNYKDFIDGSSLRRMSKIIRMGIACSKDCIQQSNIAVPDAIIVGTGLGCLVDTEKFLKNTLTIEGLIPPTSFIQSTHNTIAGQISLALKNHNYNITHTQNTLSFEHSLIDGMLCLNEESSTVLVGSADENIPLMDELSNKFGLHHLKNKLTSGASFFMLSETQNEKSKAVLIDSQAIGLNNSDTSSLINKFLEQNNLSSNDIDLCLFNTNGTLSNQEVSNHFTEIECVNYEQYCGYYFSNSAFGMHLATEILSNKTENKLTANKSVKTILLFNNFNNSNIGLTIIKSIEA
ncbi:MAG: beta-ketoacyl synthase chain length factor [Vicingaceae bacterium]